MSLHEMNHDRENDSSIDGGFAKDKDVVSPVVIPVKRGRPRKADIEAKKKRSVRGRPPGEAARIKEFYARLLSTSGDKVVQTVLRKALDDDDKDQVACLKMCIDRLLPMSYFEKEKGSGRNAVNITISGIGGSTTIEAEGSSEGFDYEDVEENDEPRY